MKTTNTLLAGPWSVNGQSAKVKPARFTVCESAGSVQVVISQELKNGAKTRLRLVLSKKEAYELADSLSVEQSSFTVKWHSDERKGRI